MKKMSLKLVFIFFMGILITGCGNTKTLTCTSTETGDGYTIDITQKSIFKNDKITKITTTMVNKFESEELAQAFYEKQKNNADYKITKDGNTITIVIENDNSNSQYLLPENINEVKEAAEKEGNKCSIS